MIKDEKIPDVIRDAVAGMLRPYVPHVDRWLEKLFAEPETEGTRAVNYLTRHDVSQRLQVSLPTVDRILKSRAIRFCKIRRSVRVSETDLEAYIATHAVKNKSTEDVLESENPVRCPPGEKREDGSLPKQRGRS